MSDLIYPQLSRSVIGRNENKALRWFSFLTAFATLCLICIGGLVTSKEAGMSVPDWPTSYGYNMFFFPIGQWWHAGNIFYEHSHRLFASGVGFLTMILTIWLWRKDDRKWMRWLGVAAFFGVVLQGVLGGIRVTAMRDEIGIFHAMLAQMFFVLISALALFQTNFWKNLANGANSRGVHGVTRPTEYLRYIYLAAVLLIFAQLMLGSTMRHQHAGLAISDFPKAHGKWWPDMSEQAVASYNAARMETTSYKPITAAQIGLQMAHRIVAVLIFFAVLISARLTIKLQGWQNPLSKISAGWMFLITTQVMLGAATIWTNKSADVATTHVAIGALSLVTGALLTIISFRLAKVTAATRESAVNVSSKSSALFEGAATN